MAVGFIGVFSFREQGLVFSVFKSGWVQDSLNSLLDYNELLPRASHGRVILRLMLREGSARHGLNPL